MNTIHLYDSRGNLLGHYSRNAKMLLTRNYQPSEAYTGDPRFAFRYRKNNGHAKRIEALIAWAAENDTELLFELMGAEEETNDD